MLRKLLKYDLLSVWKSGWGTVPVMIGCTVAAIAAARVVNSTRQYASDSIEIAVIFMLGIAAFGILICGVGIAGLVFERFYKNFYTDEGYLTFTLPVKRSTLLLSKTLNAAICALIYVIAEILCVFAFISFGNFDINLFEEIGYIFSSAYEVYGAMSYVIIGELVLVALCGLFLVISLIQFAMSIGSTATKKVRTIASIGAGYAASAIVSLILPNISGSYDWDGGAISVALLIYALMIFTLGLALYFVTLDRLSRKLNLD